MKRRYKAGDWLRVPLGGEYDAVGIIARACRSRLFGYFFSVPAAHAPEHDDLRALRAGDAIAAVLFGGDPIERARWPIVATSLPFDAQAWPFPDFASRGAFGDAWTLVRYDPQTMQIVQRRGTDEQTARALPDARFADPHEVEAILRRRIAGEPAPRAQSVYEVRSPVDPQRLRALESGGRIQFSTPLEARDLERLAAFVHEHPHVTLRVHGFRHGFDLSALSYFGALTDLALDVHEIQHASALRELHALRALRISKARVSLDALEMLPALERLELRGVRGPTEAVSRLRSLRALVLESTAPPALSRLASARTLRELVLSHGEYTLDGLAGLAELEHLGLRALDLADLSALHGLSKLKSLELEALPHVTDLRPIAQLPALCELRVTNMPHLNVGDVEPLQHSAGLREVHLAIGSRRKEREMYRLMQRGNRC